MKNLTISAIAVSAILFACPLLQSCADTTSQTRYTTNYDPGYGNSQTETTTTTTTTSDEPQSVVGATGNAAGAIIAAPFEIVGDTLGIIF
jgi:hypothetical protein